MGRIRPALEKTFQPENIFQSLSAPGGLDWGDLPASLKSFPSEQVFRLDNFAECEL
jgi:hypothetical protein